VLLLGDMGEGYDIGLMRRSGLQVGPLILSERMGGAAGGDETVRLLACMPGRKPSWGLRSAFTKSRLKESFPKKAQQGRTQGSVLFVEKKPTIKRGVPPNRENEEED